MAAAAEHIRNFCIIAHIDHGKSTLADRLMEAAGAAPPRTAEDQRLDAMELERERGITIKLKAVRMNYETPAGSYTLNLIDTPGHVDFAYEVSRSLAACEGALLVVDAAQGVEAQTLSNLYLALEHDLTVIPVINKIDLPHARTDEVKLELADLGFDPDECLLVSAREGWGIQELLEAIIQRIPPPEGDPGAPLKALVFDSHYDSYRGVVAYIRVVDGHVVKGQAIRLMSAGHDFEVDEVGVFVPDPVAVDRLGPGQVGYMVAGIKDVRQCRVGDTVTGAHNPAPEPLPGYRPVQPMVYCGLYPIDSADYEDLREALERLQLNDAALVFEPETSAALGFGFRCGFLGLLHMEIVQERLEREHDLDLIMTAPSVVYQVHLKDGSIINIDNPAKLPPSGDYTAIAEPYVKADLITPSQYVGAVMELCQERRGTYLNMSYLEGQRVLLEYELPLAEIMFDFFDQLKSRSRGHATLDYELIGYRTGDLVRLDILVSGEPVDALSLIVHRDAAYPRGRELAEKLQSIIPRQQFEVPIQAAVGSRIIARETVRALRKNVTAKCYGGDVTRKRKLLERQKEGKRRMKQIGSVEIPQEAFMAVLRVDRD
ncbi:MAG TPA: translation elongation factor 4 [Sphingobacteriaceae bacterium]|nr:translation elongation factor 4 [Sphingobacteriaceae bacterium]